MRVLLLLLIMTTSALAEPERDPDGHALVIVVDRAMTAAKIESVRLAVKDTQLSHGDQFGVIAYGKTAQIVHSFDGRKSRAVLSTTEPTNLIAGLEAAHAMLLESKRRVRRVIVVTDGEPRVSEPAIIARLRADGITVSTVGFESDNAAALSAIATAGKGRRYAADSSLRAAAAFQKELDRPPPGQETVAEVLLIDRSLYGSSIELAKEAARQRAEALSPDDMIAVIAFDSAATEYVRPQRAANRMRISHDISRVTSGAAANTEVGLQKAFDILKRMGTTEKRVVLFGTGNGANIDLVKQMAADDISVSIAAVRVRESDRAALEEIVKAGNGQLQPLTDFSLRMR